MAYILKSATVTVVLYVFMKMLMERESLHGYVRFMWLASMILSLVLPLAVIDVGETGRGIAEQVRTLVLPDVTVTGEKPEGQGGAIPYAMIFAAVYIAGAAATAAMYVWGHLKIRKIIRRCTPAEGRYADEFRTLCGRIGMRPGSVQRARLLLTEEDVSPFSIFGYVVMNRKDAESAAFRDIVLHELAHISRGHSYDLAAAEVFTVLQWFNPCAWLTKSSLAQVHEYIADRHVLECGTNIYEYQLLLIKKAVGQRFHSVANSLNHSNLKKRITMMEKNPKPGAVIKSLLALPVSAMLIVSFSAMNSSAADKVTQTSSTIQTAVPASSDNAPDGKTCSYAEADVKPRFQGGDMSSFTVWMMNQMKYPEKARNEKIGGRVVVKFTITSEGKLADTEIVKSPDEMLSEEVRRILALSPDWTPGKVDGRNVDVSVMLPVVFAISE